MTTAGDLTARKQSKDSAATDRQRCRLLLLSDLRFDVVELLGHDGSIEGVSSAITSLAGYSQDELLGRHYQDIIHPDDCAAAEAAFREVLSRGHAGPITLRYRGKDGAWRTVRVAGRNYFKDPGIGAILVITRDLTEEVRVQSLLTEANAELRRLSQQLTVARESERARIARELHDDVGQILVGLSLNMSAEGDRLASGQAAGRLASWQQLVGETLTHLRRAILDLRPPVLEKQGLAEELGSYIAHLRPVINQKVELVIDPDLGRLPPDIEMAAFRIIQQALSNAIEHSGARHLVIAVHIEDRALRISVRDDGRGFDPTAVAKTSQWGQIGLLNMRARAAEVGGNVDIVSAPLQGTEVRATFPLTAGLESPQKR